MKAFPEAEVIGIDQSPAMIAAASKKALAARFELGDIGDWKVDPDTNLIFSNAAFHWLPDHAALMQRFLRELPEGAVLALQMPLNLDEPTHVCMRETAADATWRGIKFPDLRPAMESEEGYRTALQPFARHLQVWVYGYQHSVADHADIAAFFGSTGLKPYLDQLSADDKIAFTRDYITRIESHYPRGADSRVVFTLPRLFIVAEK